MSSEPPRQPKDLKGLLKFCLEATRDEDAPPLPENPEEVLNSMDSERREWLQEALQGMSVDVIEQLTTGIKILMSSSADLDEKEETLDKLEDWLGNIDMSNNFHKIGGFEALKNCLNTPHASLRTGAAHLVAEICQNNPYCQDKLLQDGFLAILIHQLDQDEDPACRVKALYAISCMCRDFPPALDAFSKQDGWSRVLKSIQSEEPKLRTKACFFVAAVASVDARLVEDLSKMGVVHQLSAILQEPLNITHEHVLNSLLLLAQRSELARSEAQAPELRLEQTLALKLKEVGGKEEYQEVVDHINNLVNICFKDEESADR